MLQDLQDWWKQPFQSDMTGPEWLAFIGLVMVATILWSFLLGHVLKGIKEAEIT